MESTQSSSSGTVSTRQSTARVPLHNRLDIKVVHVGVRPEGKTVIEACKNKYGFDDAFCSALEAHKQFVLAAEVKKAMAETETTEGLDIR